MTQTVRKIDRSTIGSSSSSSTTTTTTVAHAPGRVLDPQDYEAIRTGYVDIIGPLNAIKAQDIEAAIQCGLDAGAVLDAIEQTGLARRPSHAYLRAILRRYAQFGIYTRDLAELDREKFAARREAANAERASWYADPQDAMPW